MSGISGVSGDSLAVNVSGYQSQIAELQRQCADWRGCATTPTDEKQKHISTLESQIQSLQRQIAKVEQAPAASDLTEKLPHTQNIPMADGVNRPDPDPFAISGSVINVSI